jgi:hypothetical protein
MSRGGSKIRALAERLIAYELAGQKSAKIISDNAFSEFEKLRPHLAALMGAGGFQTLLSRAHVLGSSGIPGLREVVVKANGTLEGLKKLHAELGDAEFSEARVVLLGNLLELLVAFIGESLTVHLVGQVWPLIPLNGLDLAGGIEHEKAEVKNEKTK